MRISRGALLVLIAFSIPVIVEFRTVLGFFGIELSLAGAFLIGAIIIGAITFWATLPEGENSGTTA